MRPPDVVVVDHHDSYTHNLVHLIAGVTGVLPALVQHDACTPAELATHDAIVLSPGPGHPDEHDWSLLDLGRPVLGVCLGLQGIVTHFGGSVDRGRPAHGVVASVRHSGTGLFEGVPQDFAAVRYHSLRAHEVPDVLEVTATCADPAGDVVMAVAHRDLSISGVQFHPESILTEHGARLVANFLERA
ncbi:aminodeoxychorismate/anthranilate synthase component II [Nocardioides humilatus]|uniref:Aminodeoxychorismate/anthranilate synthase component II n=1 Tax=Nocardioides humilatus TaxID=2607660 RepID=A0A5B1LIJ8_9ACTN|nr:aminodeoxychorismate/anthranilate synthase component II [Nocardioides humilatus]KAA1420266.1 aminodeoxychorismate/anthranilate synthase component II [Nocardioides humilatus]